MLGILSLAGLLGFAAVTASAQTPDPLERGFKNPPDSAKPRVWWHWLNGNVTKEGITADLEWMKRAGIAGMQMFDGNLGTPQFVDHRLVWMTPAWKEAFRHAGDEAARLGLEMSMAASGGWSETAGPWVKPEEAMKKIVWSETRVQGPMKFSGVLAHPPTVNGKFENMGMPPEFTFPAAPGLPGAKPMPPAPRPSPDPTFYADSKVLAYRLPEGEVRMADLHPKVTSSATGVDLASLTDGDFTTSVPLPVNPGEKSVWVQLEFEQPYRAQSITLVVGAGPRRGSPMPEGEVQGSSDGTNWLTLVSLPGPPQTTGGFPVQTYSFPEMKAKLYRIVLRPAPLSPAMAAMAASLGIRVPSNPTVTLAEIELAGPRVNHWEGKAVFGNAIEFQSIATPAIPASEVVARQDVIDVTSMMRSDGTLDWDVPAGNWVILRMGYSLTGEKNHPASPEATGFEVDKLSAKHVENYARTYAGMVRDAVGDNNFGKSFRYFLMDSWEAGVENWTDDMIPEFQKRRGYDPTPYLPVLTGRIVESAAASDKFLWDFRRTIADLLAVNHYGVFTKYVNQLGVGLYAEAMGTTAPTTGDGLLCKSMLDVPMGEFWTPSPGQKDSAAHLADVIEAGSAAHIYGKPYAATESFTTAPVNPVWASMFYLKPLGDKAMSLGINRFIFHTSDQQPFVDDQHKPGMTLGPFGQNYTRNNTYAEQAIAFNTYLARSSYLLQQGKFVGDLAYFYGEGAPATVPYWKPVNPAPPSGYAYDWVNADILLNRMSFQNGRLVLPSGMSYRALVLPDYVDEVTLAVLVKIRDLVREGAIVIAPRPSGSPSLADQSRQAEFRSIVNDVWGPVDGMGSTQHRYGEGEVYWGQPVERCSGRQKGRAGL